MYNLALMKKSVNIYISVCSFFIFVLNHLKCSDNEICAVFIEFSLTSESLTHSPQYFLIFSFSPSSSSSSILKQKKSLKNSSRIFRMRFCIQISSRKNVIIIQSHRRQFCQNLPMTNTQNLKNKQETA